MSKSFIISLVMMACSFSLLIGGGLLIHSKWALVPVLGSAPVMLYAIYYGAKHLND